MLLTFDVSTIFSSTILADFLDDQLSAIFLTATEDADHMVVLLTVSCDILRCGHK